MSAFGQNTIKGVTAEMNYGFLIAHRNVMSHLPYDHIYNFRLGGVFHTNGSHQWHHDFNFPEFNLGINYLELGNKEILGESFGFEGGVYFPFFRKKGWSLGTQLNAGVAFVTKHYDIISNPKNNAIGSRINYLITLNLRAEKQFGRNAIGLNIQASHLSNGAFKMPNLGLNLPMIGLHYTRYFDDIQFKNDSVIDRFDKDWKPWRFYSQLIVSSKQIYPAGGKNYLVLAMNHHLHYKFRNKFILEGGFDLIYNQSISRDLGIVVKESKNIQMGVYAAYVLPVHKFEFIVGVGAYVYNPLNPLGYLYKRFGGRFRIWNQLWGNITIKSHWFKADYFEYGLIYRW